FRAVPLRGVLHWPPARGASRDGPVASAHAARRIRGRGRDTRGRAVIEALRARFPERVIERDAIANAIRITVPADSLPETSPALTGERQARLVVMTGTDEREQARGYGLYYVFALPSGELVSVEAYVDPARPT